MKRIIAVLLIFVSLITILGGDEISAAQQKGIHLKKTGDEYKALQYELAGYQSRCGILKKRMDLLYQNYLQANSRINLENYKEAELSYETASFYINSGKKWLSDQWRQREGELLILVSEYQCSQKALKYYSARVSEMKSKEKEMAEKRKKGLVTSLEFRQQKLQAQNASTEWKQIRERCLRQKKEIQYKTGIKKINVVELPARKSIKYYVQKWSKEKTEYEQIKNEERAYKKYHMIFHQEIPEERDDYWYVQNQINLLSLKKKQYRSEIRKKICTLCTKYDECNVNLLGKRREIRLARQVLGRMRLLEEKGKISDRQIQEQKTVIQKLIYEEATLQCEKEKIYIQLKYGLQQITVYNE